MLKRFFARLFGRRTESGPPAGAPRPLSQPLVATVTPAPAPPPPPPPPPVPPLAPRQTEPVAVPVPLEPVASPPPEGHVRLILSDGTVVDPPVDADFEERLRYLSENVLKRRDRPST